MSAIVASVIAPSVISGRPDPTYRVRDYILVNGLSPRHSHEGSAGAPRVLVSEIRDAVAAEFSLRAADLTGSRRSVGIARPRQLAMHIAARLTSRSLAEIGRLFGGRDHSTVIHAVRRIEELLATDPELSVARRSILGRLGLSEDQA